MKIVIAGGTNEAEYIVHLFNKRGNKLVVINPSRETAELIVEAERIKVYNGAPWKAFALEESGAQDADIFISLCSEDTENYTSCMLAKTCFGAKKCICLVNDPKNVDLFEELGVDSVICSTYLLGDSIKNESSVEDIIKAISLDNNKIVMIEATVLSNFEISGKKIMDIHFPKYASISCIIRGKDVIIPNGQIEIMPKDKLMMVTSPADQNRLIAFVKKEREDEFASPTEVNEKKRKAKKSPAKKPTTAPKAKKGSAPKKTTK